MQTDDLEQKKLVYLYLMNYAKTQPELVILAVNTFVKDTDDPNPLVRALAIRTMGCLRAEKIVDYLCDPLQKCLRDENPYVRKTAALCVAKLYDLKPDLVRENGFLDTLREMIADTNPMVRVCLLVFTVASHEDGKRSLPTQSLLCQIFTALRPPLVQTKTFSSSQVAYSTSCSLPSMSVQSGVVLLS